MKETRIIIAGSREFSDYLLMKKSIFNFLDGRHIPKSSVRIVSGRAKGADENGERYAIEHGLKLSTFEAQWWKYGNSAGYLRNEEMAKFAIEDDNTGILIAFWNGTSRGTKHMINLAEKYGLETHIIYFKE